MVIFLFRAIKPMLLLAMLVSVFVLGGCSNIAVLDPKGPVAAQQKDLILLSIGFMLFIVGAVFVLFTIILVKYRERKDVGNASYNPELHGNTLLEVVWTVIPILIVAALSVPTVKPFTLWKRRLKQQVIKIHLSFMLQQLIGNGSSAIQRKILKQ